MARVRIGEAARLAGVSKSSMHRALKTGRISYETDEKGERLIDTAEVARVYPPASRTAARSAPRQSEARELEHVLEREVALLREMLERERELHRELRMERDRLLAILEAERAPRLLTPPAWWRRLRGES